VVQDAFKRIFGTADGLVAKFVYAVLVTAVVVLITIYMGRVTGKLRDLSDKRRQEEKA